MKRLALILALAAPASAHAANAEIAFDFSFYAPTSVRILPTEQVTWNGAFGSHPLNSARASEPYTNTTGTTFSHTFATAGIFRYYCGIHGSTSGDNAVGGMSGTVLVTSNLPPTASFTATPETVASGETINFDGSASSDTGGAVTHAWDLDNDGQFDDATGATASRAFTAPEGENKTYTVRLRVTDNNADEIGPESATTTRNVVAQGPGAPPPAPPGPDPTPVPSTTPTPEPDTTAPEGKLLAKRLTATKRRVRLRVSTDEPATVTARISRAGDALATGVAEVDGAATLRLRLTKAGRKALKDGDRVGARLRLVFTDDAGNAATVRSKVTAGRSP